MSGLLAVPPIGRSIRESLGFRDLPEIVAETIQLAADGRLIGSTIEDATGNQDRPPYDLPLAVERIAAAVGATRTLPLPFVLTARAYNLLYSAPSLKHTIIRLQAFEEAGADVVFARGLPEGSHFLWVNWQGWSQAHQPCDLLGSCGNDCFFGRRKRSTTQRTVQFPRPARDNAGLETKS